MCGIAGIIHPENPRPIDPARVERMCDAIAHRGPDGAGVWTDHGIALGHRRLSIIDLEGSPQPMLSADGRAVIVFNGEIYNFRALRRELEKDGTRFLTDGDTEVILAAWQKWGEVCLSRLDGMFAFALYDLEKKQLLLARDRFGVKPLFMARLSDGGIAFASELKAILAHPLMRRSVDMLAVEDYITWGYVPDHRSFLSGVEKLPAGHYRLFDMGKPAPQPRQWWDITFAERRKGKSADLEAELLHLMREAVQSRMVSDVPLGAFLSGGVDSSSVVALMAEGSVQPVTTCSIGFDVEAVDESSYAERIAALFGTDHKSRRVDPNDFGALDAIAAMFDEPFADASALPTWRVCQLAREHVTVALSGDGADEALAGYRRQVFQHHEDRLRNRIPAGIRSAILGPLASIYPKADWAPRPLRAKATLSALSVSGAEAYAAAVSITGPDQRAALYSEAFLKARGDYRAEQPFVETMETAPARSGLDRAQYADLKFWLPGDILTKVDRTSMATSLEAREPLLDHRLVEFAAALPEGQRVNGREGKAIVKRTMERYLPRDILYRPKQGFVMPIAEWFRGPLASSARQVARSKTLAALDWFDPKALSDLADRHISGRSDHGRILWQLVMLERSLSALGISDRK
ncbi:amidotransferase 1, exosortase A system-associated [Alteriqipengyuania flavescens]|uniref:XrtA/PEP-CTERM system amidotransferase n=1 Tax=Alteriqipengyuania flavescens TaxID=3053610 RepID=UPI0025B33AE8|nr:XrtA/PEP-CTERM system amidotransferase [Alteriqipengyuania flavescens]WJY18460.1 amidotransferase 1, exosortase A system-associated [Alteriqipengyuania flavescens]WJY24401.1 amidotransferase 1, exosortase A system-associated [Alteriqipengyuania flavescens]